MAVYKLLITYEGTHYHGWQIQPNGVSIQELIEKALHTITSEKIKITGAGRTDAGVHALGQVAHFHTNQPLMLTRVQGSLNGLLPKDIRILSIEQVPDNFHAQYSALSKLYRYHLYIEKVSNPFLRYISWHIPYALDLEKLKEATSYFIGTHDFTAFANESHKGVAAHDPIRTMTRIEILPEKGGLAIELEADGFLYKMVRNIIGVCVECAAGKREPKEVISILASRDRKRAGPAAPAQGLFLVKVDYPLGK